MIGPALAKRVFHRPAMSSAGSDVGGGARITKVLPLPLYRPRPTCYLLLLLSSDVAKLGSRAPRSLTDKSHGTAFLALGLYRTASRIVRLP